jgi:hypothetical protein
VASSYFCPAKFPEFCSQRGIVELFRRRQLEAVADQGVERAGEAMCFQREHVFQKRFLYLGIALAHPAIHHVTTGNVRDFTRSFSMWISRSTESRPSGSSPVGSG